MESLREELEQYFDLKNKIIENAREIADSYFLATEDKNWEKFRHEAEVTLIDSDGITWEYGDETWSYGGYHKHTFELPMNVLKDPIYNIEQIEERNRIKKEEQGKKEQELRKLLDAEIERKELETYRKLKAKFEDDPGAY